MNILIPLLLSYTRLRSPYCGTTIGMNKVCITSCWTIIGGGPYCCSIIGHMDNFMPYCWSIIGPIRNYMPYCVSIIGGYPKPHGNHRCTTLQQIVAALFEQSGQVSWWKKTFGLGMNDFFQQTYIVWMLCMPTTDLSTPTQTKPEKN